jgi:hypothetical protein
VARREASRMVNANERADKAECAAVNVRMCHGRVTLKHASNCKEVCSFA